MTVNKWTLALASLGVVSLASAAYAEEQANSVLTSLSSTTLSGYVDTSAQWNFGTGNANLPPYAFGGASKADGFNLNVVQLRIESPMDENEWAAGYRVDLWAGPDANSLNTASLFGNGSPSGNSDFAVRQAYVALRAPVGNGLDFKVGVFDTIIGYESVDATVNPNYTRSYGQAIEPTTHTGVLASYRLSEVFSASAGVANTVGPNINGRAFAPVQTANDHAESYKTYMGSLALTAPESMGFLAGSTLYAGIVNGFSGSVDEVTTSYYMGATVATPVTGLRLGAALDVLDVQNTGGETWTLAGYATMQATEKLSLHLRGEYLKDRGDQKYFTAYDAGTGTFYATSPDEVLAITATAQYDLWKNVISRLELRWDHALTGDGIYGGTSSGDGDLKNAWMLAANIIYRF